MFRGLKLEQDHSVVILDKCRVWLSLWEPNSFEVSPQGSSSGLLVKPVLIAYLHSLV